MFLKCTLSMSAVLGFVRFTPHEDLAFRSRLTLLEALNDSPDFRQNLAHAELIVSQIQAYYRLTQETCRKAISAGGLSASALARLVNCLSLGISSKPYAILEPSGENDCDTHAVLTYSTLVLIKFAEQTSQFVDKISSLEHYLSKANDNIDILLDLRRSFHRANELLENAVNHAAAASSTRSRTELFSIDEQVKEAYSVYKMTAVTYLSSVRSALTSNHMATFFRLMLTMLLAHQAYAKQIHTLFNPVDHEDMSPSTLISHLTRLANMAEVKEDDGRTSKISEQTQPVETSSVDKSASSPQLQGCLFKRGGKKGFRNWAKRWFRLQNNQLIYCKRAPHLTSNELALALDSSLSDLRLKINHNALDLTKILATKHRTSTNEFSSANDIHPILQLLNQSSPKWKTLESDLRFCTARTAYSSVISNKTQLSNTNSVSDRRFTFELIAQENRIHYLQATNITNLELWVNTLRSGLSHLQHGVSPNHVQSTCYSPSISGSYECENNSNFNKFSRPNSIVTGKSQVLDYEKLRSQCGILLWREPDWSGLRYCADCKAENACWAAINLGVTLCTNCASIHRSLGVHVSKVRSLTLDNWEPESLHVMLNLGNRLVNQIYEANLFMYPHLKRPTLHSSIDKRLEWIRNKWASCRFAYLPLVYAKDMIEWLKHLYENWLYMRKHNLTNYPQLLLNPQQYSVNNVSNNQLNFDTNIGKCAKLIDDDKSLFDELILKLNDLIKEYQKAYPDSNTTNGKRKSTLPETVEHQIACQLLLDYGAMLGCPLLMLLGLTGGANPDGKYYKVTDSLSANSPYLTPLIWAVKRGSLAACEFLLLNGADIDKQDHEGYTALHHACNLGRTHLVCLLLRRRANQMIANYEGRFPLDIAVDLTNADIVTLLRLERLNTDNKNSDFNLKDETVTDVFRDFTSRAYFLDCDESSEEVLLNTDRNSNLHTSLSSPDLNENISVKPIQQERRVILVKRINEYNNKSASLGTPLDNRRRTIINKKVVSITGGSNDVNENPSSTSDSNLNPKVNKRIIRFPKSRPFK